MPPTTTAAANEASSAAATSKEDPHNVAVEVSPTPKVGDSATPAVAGKDGKPPPKPKEPAVAFRQLFRYATTGEIALNCIACLGACYCLRCKPA